MDEYISIKTEYQHTLDFIAQLQEEFLRESNRILTDKKEVQYKKRQREIFEEEQEKKKVKNISMFSPLSSEESYEDSVEWKEEMTSYDRELERLEKEWKRNSEKLANIEALKNMITQTKTVGPETETKLLNNNFNQVTDYSAKLLEMQELERNRIARDLHDSSVQGMTMLVHKAEYCSKMLDIDPILVKLELQTMIEATKEIINGMREIIYDLRPMALNNLGFLAAIESYCSHLRKSGTMEVVLLSEGQEQRLPSLINVMLYRILQEGCSNSIKYSKARSLWIRLNYKPDSVELELEDDGVGFNSDTNDDTSDELHGFGLSTMKERINLIQGKLEVESRKGNGTILRITVPVSYVDSEDDMA